MLELEQTIFIKKMRTTPTLVSTCHKKWKDIYDNEFACFKNIHILEGVETLRLFFKIVTWNSTCMWQNGWSKVSNRCITWMILYIFNKRYRIDRLASNMWKLRAFYNWTNSFGLGI
jgi:hypothetical protein